MMNMNTVSQARCNCQVLIKFESFLPNFSTLREFAAFGDMHGFLFNSKFITKESDVYMHHVHTINIRRNIASICIQLLHSYRINANRTSA